MGRQSSRGRFHLITNTALKHHIISGRSLIKMKLLMRLQLFLHGKYRITALHFPALPHKHLWMFPLLMSMKIPATFKLFPATGTGNQLVFAADFVRIEVGLR